MTTKNFPEVPFKMKCEGRDEAVLTWLHDNGVKWCDGDNVLDFWPVFQVRHLLVDECKCLTWSGTLKPDVDCQEINPYDFINKLKETNMDTTQLEQKLVETKKQIEELEKQLAEAKKPKKPKQWEPEGGLYVLTGDLDVCKSTLSRDMYRLAGAERPTIELAEKAAKIVRKHNRLLAYVHEHAPDYEPVWDNWTDNFYVYFSTIEKAYSKSCRSTSDALGIVYMPEDVAEGLVRKLNSGEVVL